MPTPASSAKPKACSRGHTFTGPGPCPVCWPGGARRKAGADAANKRGKRD